MPHRRHTVTLLDNACQELHTHVSIALEKQQELAGSLDFFSEDHASKRAREDRIVKLEGYIAGLHLALDIVCSAKDKQAEDNN